jgi:hypothetical protein
MKQTHTYIHQNIHIHALTNPCVIPSRLTFRKAQHVSVPLCTSVCIKVGCVKLSSLSHRSSEFAHLDEAPYRFHKKFAVFWNTSPYIVVSEKH